MRTVTSKEPHGVARLDVLRENEHTYLGVMFADVARSHEAFVGVCGGHPDVDNRNVGSSEPDMVEEPLGVFSVSHHLDAGIAEQANDALPR